VIHSACSYHKYVLKILGVRRHHELCTVRINHDHKRLASPFWGRAINDFFDPMVFIPLLALVFYLDSFCSCVVGNSFDVRNLRRLQ
jgi:hypothetical protein